ncbi:MULTISPECIES: flagellar hook-associated protein FlgK [unclassified Paracoccus (in: a-proteobacteria)]|uniref:flagellar hook-associated protein FlgK n=1 Tax=unclassified Paracoccus (in: a-proteobacteria) TaxID=2688777 RepID=UPI0012B413E1|nr:MULTISPECIES: flagellar hook-associated protein FlgK [unclassified Paracoccus (in: a-proteobacteria)]UXU75842.1 flagellar hook-associated protein FlgK [Paracoccus sp. SMMA_5]UXU81751.1 flagellar hook-associated protein FlgK [Paracoccus sp. SMMA_5_TC]
MSISSAIMNAVSGLTAVSRGTEVTASNLANALTEGYGRRSLALSPQTHSGGVRIDGIARAVNADLLREYRLANAGRSQADALSHFAVTLETAFGDVTQTGSLLGALSSFNTALTQASARPDSDQRLMAVVDSARNLAGKLNGISRTIQDERLRADQAIARDIETLNKSLHEIANLNRNIVSLAAQGQDSSALLDARQKIIDDLSGLVRIREVPRENGTVAIFSDSGFALLDGTTPLAIDFVGVTAMTPQMTVANGDLGQIMVGGAPMSAAHKTMFEGGRIAANLAIRDTLAPAHQARLDGLAREIYDRLADPAIDGTLAAGQPGLFSDGASALDPLNEVGFAGRIALNPAADPQAGGQLWRIRAGMSAATPGDVGNSTLINRMVQAFETARTPVSLALSGPARSIGGLTGGIASIIATERVAAEGRLDQLQTHGNSLKQALLAEGVDSDQEMESLMALERAYAANAKVLQTANEMLDTILGVK